jgi:hypothetical protein
MERLTIHLSFGHRTSELNPDNTEKMSKGSVVVVLAHGRGCSIMGPRLGYMLCKTRDS